MVEIHRYRLNLIFVSCLLAFGLLFINQPAISGTLSQDIEIDHDGNIRTFDYYLPDKLAHRAPLVFLLHGQGGSADTIFGTDPERSHFPFKVMMEIADRIGFIICAPDGVPVGNDRRGWNDCRDIDSNPDTDDVDFIDKLISWFSGNFKIDRQRIYAAGISNGGHMSLRLAVELGDKIAAVGAVCAAMPDPSKSKCPEPNDEVGVLYMVGTIDPVLPFEGGDMAFRRGKVLSNADSVLKWVEHNNTIVTPHVYEFPDINFTDGGGGSHPVTSSTVTRSTFSQGQKGAAVVNYVVNEGSHSSPSIKEQYDDEGQYQTVYGRQNNDIEMAEELWRFFAIQTLNRKLKAYDLTLLKTMWWDVYPDFASQTYP